MEDWSSGIATSVGGNLITGIIVVLIFLIKNKCKHYESSCNLSCCRATFSDRTLHRAPEVSRPPREVDLEEPGRAQLRGEGHTL